MPVERKWKYIIQEIEKWLGKVGLSGKGQGIFSGFGKVKEFVVNLNEKQSRQRKVREFFFFFFF